MSGEEPAWLAERLEEEDPAPVISEMALAGRSPLCAKALNLFVILLGAEAGNLALKLMASGGVYLGGGIPPKIVKALKGSTFREAFVDKGRMKPLLEAIPVRVILDEKVGQRGAARCAILQA